MKYGGRGCYITLFSPSDVMRLREYDLYEIHVETQQARDFKPMRLNIEPAS